MRVAGKSGLLAVPLAAHDCRCHSSLMALVVFETILHLAVLDYVEQVSLELGNSQPPPPEYSVNKR